MLSCRGCEDFSCARGCYLLSLIDGQDEAAKQWLVSHQLVYDATFCTNHAKPERCVLFGETWQCPKGNCRHRCCIYEPLLDSYHRTSALTIIRILLLYVAGMGQNKIVREVRVSKNAVGAAVGKIERVLAAYSDIRVDEISCEGGRKALQVDETAFSQRKQHQGKRVRQAGCEWVETFAVTRTDGGQITEVVLIPVEDRTSETLIGNINKIANRYCMIRTDGWKGYKKLDENYSHAVVIHKKGSSQTMERIPMQPRHAIR